jgi:hypothetical protein
MSRSATNLLEMSSGDINSIHKRAVSSPIENVNNHSEEQPNRYTNPRRSSKVYQEIHVDKNANYRQKRNKRANEACRTKRVLSYNSELFGLLPNEMLTTKHWEKERT